LVVAADETPLPAVRQAISRLTHVNTPLVGAVLNKARHLSTDSYFYGGRYTYGKGEGETTEGGVLGWVTRRKK
ncbi:MAG: hypothetical protein HY608_04800, partial [Planctomycetes bacterium]|nr:hypothetical protein [Planctomycetota bacterium]